MGKRLLTGSYRRLREDVVELLGPEEEPPSMTQLERWRRDGYIRPTIRHGRGRGPGMWSRYASETAGDVVSLMRLLKAKHRLSAAVLPQFLAGHWIDARLVRPIFLDAYSELRSYMEGLARILGAKGRGRLDAETITATLAHAMRLRAESRGGRTSPAMLYVERMREAAQQIPDGDPGELVETVLTHLLYTFLTGRFFPYSGDVHASVPTATGAEELFAGLASLLGQAWLAELPRNMAGLLPLVSLPQMQHAARCMDTEAFLRARDEYLRLRHVLVPVLGLLDWLGADFSSMLPRRESALSLGMAFFLPAAPAIRRQIGQANLNEWLRMDESAIPDMEALARYLATPQGKAVDEDALRQDMLAGIRAETSESMEVKTSPN